MDETSPGRPPKLSTEEWQRLKQDLENPPAEFGLEGRKWQGKLLQSHLATAYGIEFSLRQCQRLLKQVRQRQSAGGYKSDTSRNYTPATDRVAAE